MTSPKKALVAVGGIVAVLAGLGVVYRADLQLVLMVMEITPDQSHPRGVSSGHSSTALSPPSLELGFQSPIPGFQA